MKRQASSGCRVALGWVLPLLVAVGLSAAGTALAEEQSGAVLFRGNEDFDEGRLRKEAEEGLTSFAKTGRRSDADDAAWQMESAYLAEGYASVEVRYDFEKNEAGTGVTYLIAEGPRVLLDRIDLLGNEELPEEDLMKFFKAGGGEEGKPFVASRIEEAARSVRDYY